MKYEGAKPIPSSLDSMAQTCGDLKSSRKMDHAAVEWYPAFLKIQQDCRPDRLCVIITNYKTMETNFRELVTIF